jgi:dipeptidyl aminopeptidase/acylaminoacyl peptidase
LGKYSFETLRTTSVPKNDIKIGKVIAREKSYTSYIFTHTFDPTFSGGKPKTTTGMINLPTGSQTSQKFPLVIMFRGYVDPKIYTTGIGSKPAAAEFANAGFMTVAPDFFGYAGSDTEAGDVLESRFQTYTTALSILHNIDSLEKWDHKNVFIWGHSNGGQIALTVLEITSLPIPTVLWAPVSKPFPYSILYYTDESADGGKFLRNEISKFESMYNSDNYSLVNYLSNIKAPMQLHQGNADDAVPIDWTNELVSRLKKNAVNVEYFTYDGADHNLRPSWNIVVERNIAFFKNNMHD